MAITGRIVPNTAHPDPGLGTEAKPWPVLHVTEIHSPALDGFVDDEDPRLSDARTPLSHAHEITDVTGLSDALGDKADAASLGGAALLDVGTTEGTVAAGNDSRLSDPRTPLSHGHAAGDVSGLGGAAYKNVGTGADDVAAGDHSHTISGVDGMQAALDLKAPLASPEFSGTPLVPTAAAGTNTTQAASTAFVQNGLGGKSDASHVHLPEAVTSLPTEPVTGKVYARFADDDDDGHYYWTGTEWRQL